MRSREEILECGQYLSDGSYLILEVLLDIRELLVIERPGLAINTIRKELGQDIVKAMVGEEGVRNGMD